MKIKVTKKGSEFSVYCPGLNEVIDSDAHLQQLYGDGEILNADIQFALVKFNMMVREIISWHDRRGRKIPATLADHTVVIDFDDASYSSYFTEYKAFAGKQISMETRQWEAIVKGQLTELCESGPCFHVIEDSFNSMGNVYNIINMIYDCGGKHKLFLRASVNHVLVGEGEVPQKDIDKIKNLNNGGCDIKIHKIKELKR